MPEKEPGKSMRHPRPASVPSEDYPVTSSGYPSGDYSYTVELVGSIQHQLGKLTEAVETLKTQADSHGKELIGIGRSIHTAKVLLGIIGAVVTAIATFAGIALKAYLDHIWHPGK